MNESLLKYKEILNSWESVIFIIACIVAVIVFAFYCRLRYLRLHDEIELAIAHFNKHCFVSDRIFFEHYGSSERLEPRDFLRMARDEPFKKQLWSKEIDYYDRFIKIVNQLRVLQFYRRAFGVPGLALFVFLVYIVMHGGRL